ncbi:hypothetical protein F4809DRAFT_644195 [Biscogniauxia mediterranea]|nr:hypothetical protein F4809DRAFT_644195 [Biscogniauxia mediterranea]
MQPLVSVNTHNHVALISITIAPSTFLAALALTFVFLYTYLVSTGHIPLRIIASNLQLPRLFARNPSADNTQSQHQSSALGLLTPLLQDALESPAIVAQK